MEEEKYTFDNNDYLVLVTLETIKKQEENKLKKEEERIKMILPHAKARGIKD